MDAPATRWTTPISPLRRRGPMTRAADAEIGITDEVADKRMDQRVRDAPGLWLTSVAGLCVVATLLALAVLI